MGTSTIHNDRRDLSTHVWEANWRMFAARLAEVGSAIQYNKAQNAEGRQQ